MENTRGYSEQLPRFNPVYGDPQVDQLILTPEGRATQIIKKRPRIIKKPVFALDEYNQKIPAMDERGNIKTKDDGEEIYIVKDWIEEQDGWESVIEPIPASEIFTNDSSTSNIGMEAVKVLTLIGWHYNHVMVYQRDTNTDFSEYIHLIRNDYLTILNAAKSYNGTTIQAIKTFINKMDSKQWLQQPDEQKNGFNPFAAFFGGKKKEVKKEANNTAFS